MSGAQSLGGTSGNDTITGGSAGDVLGFDTVTNTFLGGNDSISGAQGADTIFANGGDTVTGGATGDLLILRGGDTSNGLTNVISGGNSGGGDIDFLAFGFNGAVSVSGSTDPGAGGTVTYTVDGRTFTSTVTNVENVIVANPLGGADTLTWANFVNGGTQFVCFAEGTNIMTSLGEVPVEDLRGGDLVATVSGDGAPMKPVLWVGRRRVSLADNPAAEQICPVRIKAGALAEGVPHRDLLVSPDHCMFLDGALVPARLLVNGTSIVVEREFAAITYYHVELETHDVLLAEGAAAESWLDAGNRAWFENAAVAQLAVHDSLDAYGTGWDASRACAPLVHGGAQLAAIRAGIETRAEVVMTAAAAQVRAA
jgi:hypothetical protein